jgi:lycopene beta-cyclase
MTAPVFDAVIAGGGLAGLSLAAHLAASRWRDRTVLVVDDPARPAEAVSWGFWSAAPGLLDAAVSRSFDRVRIHAAGTSRVLPLDPYRYQVVHRADLERTVRKLTGECPGFRFLDGHVEHVRHTGEVVVDGHPVRGGWVFDSVTAPPPGAPAEGHLAFTGWEVRCADPVFEPDLPVLFDFRTPQRGGSRFRYVLPHDAHRALVELTAFVPGRVDPPRPAELARYLHGGYEILRTESAVLPLRTRPVPRRAGRMLRIGARAGLVKASTGYGYQRIQRDSAAIAASLAAAGHPFGRPARPRRYRLLDAVLLEVLRRDPVQLELAFARLFRANPAGRVLRFLDEDTRVGDDLRLIGALPPVPYLRAATGLALRAIARAPR